MISRQEMNELVDDGRARRWTRPVGGEVPDAVHMDGHWYVVLAGTEGYQRASELVAAALTEVEVSLGVVLGTADTFVRHGDVVPAP
jgi:hypothetical protein